MGRRRGGMTGPEPRRAFPRTPPPLPGSHDLRLSSSTPLKVFIDTYVFFQWSCRAAIAASARQGDLAVF
jgi:hypothetical protein